MATKSKKKKKSLFGKFYTAYLIILILAIALLFFYVRSIMVEYEEHQPDNYVLNLLAHAGKADKALGEYLQENCFNMDGFGDPSARQTDFYNTDAYAKLATKKNLAYSEDDIEVYDVTADDKPFVTVALKNTGSKNKLGILNIADYKLEYVFLRNPETKKTAVKMAEDGTMSFTVSMPEDFTLYFDGAEVVLTDKNAAAIEDFNAFSEFDAVPQGIEANFCLCYDPVVTVKNNVGEEVRVSLDGSRYIADADYGTSPEAEEVAAHVGNPLKINELWAEFMTDDVPGYYHGLYTVLEDCQIMPGSKLENLAESWATSIDITFVSDHYGYYFENEKVDNYVLYNENFFSCDVSFDEIVQVYGVGDTKVAYNNRMFFVQDGGTWYWVGQLDLTGRE